MKFTLSWLKEHLDTEAPLETIARKLTAIGLEVEHITDRAAALSAFKVAEIQSAEKHPDADRLRVCRVDTGKEILQIVCGAPNARAGIKVVLAHVGATIPATGLVLKKGVIRGVESQGMMCSAREMGLSDEHDGIIELPASAPLGVPFAGVIGLDDPIIEINLTPNRADCAGVRGIARDLAAAGLGTLKPLTAEPIKGAFPCPVEVAITDAKACPAFAGRLIKGVKNGPSPDWLRKRLEAIGHRSISALVDITNYMAFDWPRPLHVFDAAKLAGNLAVRSAKDGETLLALNGKEYTLKSGMIVIADKSGALGLGGVMGGISTSCSEATTDVYIESALFDQAQIAATGQALQIVSDARYRFERGIDPASVLPGLERATRLVLDICGGTPSEISIAGAIPTATRTIIFDPAHVARLTGVEVESAAQKSILAALGCAVAEQGEKFSVTIPSWRQDIVEAADLVEEILRLHGFDAIPVTSLPRPTAVTASALDIRQRRTTIARRTLAGQGLMEAVTWSFMSRDLALEFGQDEPKLRIVNPISADLDQMRPSIVGNLLLAAKRNADRAYPNTALFEIGPVWRSTEETGQELHAALLRTGEAVGRNWQDNARVVDAFDAKADVFAVLETLGVPTGGAQITRDAPHYYHPGRSGAMRLGPAILAVFGELHPDLKAKAGFEGSAVAAEIYLERLPLPKKSGTAKPPLQLAALQPVERDFAFVVRNEVTADSLIRAIRSTDKILIKEATIFDVYAGAGIPDGHKSLACSVTLQPAETALTEKDLDALASAVIANVKTAVGGVIRV